MSAPAREAAGSAGLSSRELDAVKGFFIALIVLGHNTAFTTLVPRSFEVLYNFHVYAFFFLPFLRPARPLSRSFVGDRAVRYLVPHAWFYGLACVAFAWLSGAMLPELLSVLEGLLLASPDAIGRASGLRMYWFLPALLALVLLRSTFASVPGWARVGMLAAMLAFHPAVQTLPRGLKGGAPWGIPIALFVFPLGVVAALLWSHRGRLGEARLGGFATVVWVGGSILSWATDTTARLAQLAVYSFHEPLRLLLHDALPIAAFLSVCWLSPWLVRIPGVVRLGHHSLVVYLLHSLLYQALLHTVGVRLPGGSATLAFAAASYAVTLVASLGVAELGARSASFRAWVTPRGAEVWPPTRRIFGPGGTKPEEAAPVSR